MSIEQHLCEICGHREGKFHADFDGYVCEECQAEWATRAPDDQTIELDCSR